ncbi:MAG: hypothetical protein U1B83_05040, partial [Candidatus Cloacimonadaceae bacterium]|nr:hypothetical protein [Candidatus Cloacimonadaceae bacterium]
MYGSSWDQNYHNVIWECGGLTGILDISTGGGIRSVAGDFVVQSTNTGRIRLNNNTSGYALNVLGSFEIRAGIFEMVGVNGDGNQVSVNIGKSFIQSGGTITKDAGGTSVCGFFFNSSGLQSFTKSAGSISNAINFTVASGSQLDFGLNVLNGSSGSFTLESGATLITAHPQGISASGAFGSIQSTGARTFSNTASYVYNGAQAQVSGSALPVSVMDLTIDNVSGVTLSNAVTVNGTLHLLKGNLSGTRLIDGYQDANLRIEENDVLISGLTASSASADASSPYVVKRDWSISGSVASAKTITFYWSAEDDANFNWGSRVPAVFNGAIQYDGDAFGNEFNISSDPRWIRVTAPISAAKSLWHIGLKDGDDTLPVELSSFSVFHGAQNSVQIMWITQSESDCLGFHVYRGTEHDFGSALRLEQFVSATNTSQPQSYVVFDTDMDCAGTLYYWLEGLDLDGSSTIHGPISILIHNYSSGSYVDVPLITQINSLYPNPFNPLLTIDYSVLIPGPVSLKIYNCKGQIVKAFPAVVLERGSFRQVWDGWDSSGRTVGSG